MYFINRRLLWIISSVCFIGNCTIWCDKQCIVQYQRIILPKMSTEKPRQILNLVIDDHPIRIFLWKQNDNIFERHMKIRMIQGNATTELDYSKFAATHKIPRVEYGGTVFGKAATSWAYGTVNFDGMFDGSFGYDNLTFYIEPLSNYFSGSHDEILYRSTDISPCRKNDSTPMYVNEEEKRRGNLRRRSRRNAKKRLVETLTERAAICHIRIIADYRFYQCCYPSKLPILWEGLNEANIGFRSIDVENDGKSSHFGFRVTEFFIYKDPIRNDLIETITWDPVTYFKELSLYNFKNICGGFLLTYRQLDPTTEILSPSLYKSNPIDNQQGVCSPLPQKIPSGTLDDYGEFMTNALPINFKYKDGIATVPQITGQVAHQFSHLMGAMDDNYYNDPSCIRSPLTNLPFLGNFPVVPINSSDDVQLSSCGKSDVLYYIMSFSRLCFKSCNGDDRRFWELSFNSPPANFVETTTTTEPTPKPDWTEVCFTYLIDDAPTRQISSFILLLSTLGTVLLLFIT